MNNMTSQFSNGNQRELNIDPEFNLNRFEECNLFKKKSFQFYQTYW